MNTLQIKEELGVPDLKVPRGEIKQEARTGRKEPSHIEMMIQMMITHQLRAPGQGLRVPKVVNKEAKLMVKTVRKVLRAREEIVPYLKNLARMAKEELRVRKEGLKVKDQSHRYQLKEGVKVQKGRKVSLVKVLRVRTIMMTVRMRGEGLRVEEHS